MCKHSLNLGIKLTISMRLLHSAVKSFCMFAMISFVICASSVFITAQDCITSPVITCPPIFFGCISDDTSPDALGYATAIPGDANCPTPIVTYRDSMTSNDLCGSGRIIKRFWKATYPDNTNPWLLAECTQVLVLSDMDAPVITNCPPDVVVGTDSDCRAIVRWDAPTATDDCGLLGFTSNFGSGSAFYPGVTTVTYTATDFCGNMTTCSFTVTVQEACCNDTPSLTIPNDYVGCPNSSLDPSTTGMATGTISGANCGAPIITYTDVTSSNGDCNGEILIERTWTATNPNNSNASSSGIQWITLSDNDSPIITNCPTDITIVSNANCMAVVTWPTPTAIDDCGLFSFASNYTSGSSFSPGTTTVTYTAVDNCGNTSSCSFNITVVDNCCDGAPILQLPPNYSGCPGSSSDPSVTGTAVATLSGTGCGTPTVTYSDEVISSDDCGSVIKRTWLATNPNFTNQRSAGTQTISLEDSSAPTISNCPSDITVMTDSNCLAVVSWTTPTAFDNCSIQSFTSNYASGATFSPGTTTVTYTAIDNCGLSVSCSFKVTVIANCCDGTPNLVLPANFTGCTSSSYEPSVTGMATASLPGSGCSAPTITFSDELITDGDCGLTVRRTWVATNPSYTNLTATGIQTISLVDTTDPTIINCPNNITVTTGANCQAVVTWSSPSAMDNCGIQSFTSNYSSGATFSPGTTTVTYTAIDGCGNSVSCSFDVTVNANCCDGVPNLVLPPDYSGCPGSPSDPSVTGTATASISGTGCSAPTITHSDELITDSDCGLTIRRTWVATNPDYTSQTSSGIQVITLEDNTSPVIINCPADITVNSNSDCVAIVNFMAPSATDNCGIASFMSDRPTGSGSRFDIGTTTITYTAIDNCGNESTCSFSVTVLPNCCNDDMIVICPDDYTTCPGSSIDPSVAGTATTNASSDCPATVTHYDVVVSQSSCSGGQVVDRYWVATRTDGSESDTCIQRITTEDTQSPVITSCLPDVTLSFTERVYTWNDPSISDNCGTTVTYSIPKGTTFAVGSTQVEVRVTDNCGNTTSCQFSVTVLPQNSGAGLFVTCPEDLVLSCDNSSGGRVPIPEVTSDCELCHEGDIAGFVYMGEYNGHKYYCSRDKMTWPDAQEFCEANGGGLAIINDAAENTFLANVLQANSAYIGLSDHLQEGSFNWIDGSPLSYSKWYPQQPNNYNNNQDYVELLRNGYWNDQYNSKKLEFIMEVSCITVTQTSGPTYLSDVDGPTTVSFSIEDACGNTETCSYNISLSNEVNLTCPQDMEFTTTEDQIVVYYDTPNFETCCSNCTNHGSEIPGFVFMGSRDGSYYYCSKDKDTWHNANQVAREMGGHLAIIESAEENSFLANILTNTIAFIGISDHANEGDWRNVNGGVQRYFNWRSDNPNNYEGLQHYVELEPSGKWNDNTGSYKREYIIELTGCGSLRQTGGIASGGFFPKGATKVSFEAIDDCGNSRTCSFDVEVTGESTVHQDYCDSQGNNSSKGHIQSVQIGNQLHTSGNNGGYYHNNTCIDLEAGEKFKLIVTPGWSSFRYLAHYKIYMDFNGNGLFTDPGEYLGKAKSSGVIAGNLGIPSSAKPGLTRMRIAMSLTGYPEPCGAYYYGETEDHCVNILGATSLSPIKDVGSKSAVHEVTELTEIKSAFITESVLAYPNPAGDFFRLSDDDLIKELSIIGMDGRALKSINRPNGQIDVSDLPSGVYILKLTDLDGLEMMDKIIIE